MSKEVKVEEGVFVAEYTACKDCKWFESVMFEIGDAPRCCFHQSVIANRFDWYRGESQEVLGDCSVKNTGHCTDFEKIEEDSFFVGHVPQRSV